MKGDSRWSYGLTVASAGLLRPIWDDDGLMSIRSIGDSCSSTNRTCYGTPDSLSVDKCGAVVEERCSRVNKSIDFGSILHRIQTSPMEVENKAQSRRLSYSKKNLVSIQFNCAMHSTSMHWRRSTCTGLWPIQSHRIAPCTLLHTVP